MQRKYKNDYLTFNFKDIPLPLDNFRKGVSFLFKNRIYHIDSEPFFDLDDEQVILTVSYEVYDF